MVCICLLYGLHLSFLWLVFVPFGVGICPFWGWYSSLLNSIFAPFVVCISSICGLYLFLFGLYFSLLWYSVLVFVFFWSVFVSLQCKTDKGRSHLPEKMANHSKCVVFYPKLHSRALHRHRQITQIPIQSQLYNRSCKCILKVQVTTGVFQFLKMFRRKVLWPLKVYFLTNIFWKWFYLLLRCLRNQRPTLRRCRIWSGWCCPCSIRVGGSCGSQSRPDSPSRVCRQCQFEKYNLKQTWPTFYIINVPIIEKRPGLQRSCNFEPIWCDQCCLHLQHFM